MSSSHLSKSTVCLSAVIFSAGLMACGDSSDPATIWSGTVIGSYFRNALIRLDVNANSKDVSQVGDAVTQMNQATQQNAALVEKMAVSANNLKFQAQELEGTVAAFKLAVDGPHQSTAASQRVDQTTDRTTQKLAFTAKA